MKLGFYYHIAIHHSEKGLSLPAYLGLFIDSLASEVEQLVLFMHEATVNEAEKCDYTLRADNIEFVSLGIKTPAWERFLWPGRTLEKISHRAEGCDLVLVRAPSPLAPAFKGRFKNIVRVCYMIVGDYAVSSQYLKQPWWRKRLIVLLSKRNDRQLTAAVKKSTALVNSTILYNKYRKIADQIFEIKTTTLRESDFFKRDDTCRGMEIKILYAGRFDFSKGLHELVQGVSIIKKEGYNVSLHFAGWEDDIKHPVEKLLRKISVDEGIDGVVYFHGRRTIGDDLNKMYRMADIYVIPSYQEGFPRTIWEAMANSLPVIATRVGSIPYLLQDRENALLIEPKSKEEIVSATISIITGEELRRKLIRNGFATAKGNTLEIQAKRIGTILNNLN